MYLVEFVPDKHPDKFQTWREYAEYGETTEDAIILSVLIKALMRITRPCEIRIFTKAKSVFSTLESRRYNTWRDNNWLKGNGEAVKNAHLWDVAQDLLASKSTEWTVSDEDHSYQEYMRSELKKWQRA